MGKNLKAFSDDQRIFRFHVMGQEEAKEVQCCLIITTKSKFTEDDNDIELEKSCYDGSIKTGKTLLGKIIIKF